MSLCSVEKNAKIFKRDRISSKTFQSLRKICNLENTFDEILTGRELIKDLAEVSPLTRDCNRPFHVVQVMNFLNLWIDFFWNGSEDKTLLHVIEVHMSRL